MADLVVPGVPLRDAIKIKSVFSPESAEAILKLPCPLGGIDKAAVLLLLVVNFRLRRLLERLLERGLLFTIT